MPTEHAENLIQIQTKGRQRERDTTQGLGVKKEPIGIENQLERERERTKLERVQ